MVLVLQKIILIILTSYTLFVDCNVYIEMCMFLNFEIHFEGMKLCTTKLTQ